MFWLSSSVALLPLISATSIPFADWTIEDSLRKMSISLSMFRNQTPNHAYMWVSTTLGKETLFQIAMTGSLSRMTTKSWHTIGPILADNYTVIAVDFRGMGQSIIPSNGDYTSLTTAKDLKGVLISLTSPRQTLSPTTMVTDKSPQLMLNLEFVANARSQN